MSLICLCALVYASCVMEVKSVINIYTVRRIRPTPLRHSRTQLSVTQSSDVASPVELDSTVGAVLNCVV